jgi:hypothetical protein|tara:strand:- start:76 stop:450 length:375 start_codon:yes stop_codon:yes gene_type:complete
MGQRVNIQYSVELDDLQDEVNRLYSNALTEVECIGASKEYSRSQHRVSLDLSGLQKIDALRTKMAQIDIMLSDIQNIIDGFVRYKMSAESEDSRDEDVGVEKLQDKIARFKEIVNANADQESAI